MIRILLWFAGDLSISDRLLIGAYMGGPLARALPFRHRIIAAAATWYAGRVKAQGAE